MSDKQVEVFDRLLELAVLLQNDLEQSFAGRELTTARTHLMWELNNRGPSTQQVLAKALDVSPRNITGLVDALSHNGYVERRPHPTDRRATLVTLTDQGAATMAAMVDQRKQAAAQLTEGLSARRLGELNSTLGLLAGRLRQLVAEASGQDGS
jgi:DNA-binding MarR family transcriptional regulator